MNAFFSQNLGFLRFGLACGGQKRWLLLVNVVAVIALADVLLFAAPFLLAQSPSSQSSSVQSPSAPLPQDAKLLLYERSGKRCAEVSWQAFPHSNDRLTWYLQEIPSGEPYTCLIARGLDPTKSYELLFQPPLPLYHFASSASHRINPHALPTMHEKFSPDFAGWYSAVLFCREDADYVPSIFPERVINSDAFYVALLYVSRKEKKSEYAKAYQTAAKRSKATILAKPQPHLTAMDTLVSPAAATALRAFDLARIAEQHVKAHNLDRAVLVYSTALQQCPTYQKAYFERGHLYLHLGAAPKALDDFNHALALDSSDYRVWGNRASALYQCGQFQEAIASAERAVQLKPNQTGASLFRAFSFEALGDTTNASRAALSLVRQLVEANETEDKIHDEALALAERTTAQSAWREHFQGEAERAAENDEYTQAVAYWNYLLRRDPANVHALYQRCYDAAFAKMPYYSTSQYADSLFAYAPNTDSAYFARGLLLYSGKYYDKAKQDFTTAITLRPSYAQAYLRRSMTRHSLKESPDSVRNDLHQALHHKPQDRWLWYQGARYFSVIDEHDSTVKYASAAIALDSLDFDAYRIRAEALDKLENPLAIADYSRCIQLVERVKNAENIFRDELSDLYRERGRTRGHRKDTAAAGDFETSLRILPSPEGFGYRADWQYQNGFYLEAMKGYDSVLARIPSSPYCRYMKADCHYHLKEYMAALALLNDLIAEKKYRQADVYYLRAYINNRLDDDEGFCNDLHRAANAGSKEAEADLLQYCSGEEDEGG